MKKKNIIFYKKISIIIILLVFISNPKVINALYKKLQDQTTLIGKWKIYNFGNMHSPARCNVCPSISFKDSGVGILTTSKEEKFKWYIRKDSSLIISDSLDLEGLPLHGAYKYKITNHENFTELLLIDNESGNEYVKHFVLRRRN